MEVAEVKRAAKSQMEMELEAVDLIAKPSGIEVIKAEINKYNVEVLATENKGKNLSVSNAETHAAANDVLVVLKTIGNRIESRRDWLVRPMNDRVKEINASFKPLQIMIEKSEKDLKAKVNAYLLAEQRAREAENARILKLQREEEARIRREEEERQKQEAAKKAAYEKAQREAAEANRPAPPPPAPPPAPAPAAVIRKPEFVAPPPKTMETNVGGSVTARKKPVWEVVNAESIPDEYWIPRQLDEKKVNADVKSGLPIPGIKIEWVPDATVRGL